MMHTFSTESGAVAAAVNPTKEHPSAVRDSLFMQFVGGVLCLCGVGAIVSELMVGVGQGRNDDLFLVLRAVNMSIALIILLASVVAQRKSFRELQRHGETFQQNRVNLTLLFMAVCYYAFLAGLYAVKPNDHAVQNNGAAPFLVCAVGVLDGAHFVGNLRWGKIFAHRSCHVFSLNWWCCIYLIVCLFAFMVVTVTTPWFRFNSFVELHHLIEELTGDFIHVLLYDICRPTLTIVSYRCIEQIIHQLVNGEHRHPDVDHDVAHHGGGHVEIYHRMENDEDEDTTTVAMDSTSSRMLFPTASALGFLVAMILIMFACVTELMTAAAPPASTRFVFGHIVWSLIQFCGAVWSVTVMFWLHKQRTNRITCATVLRNHLALLISCVGVIISMIGMLGVDQQEAQAQSESTHVHMSSPRIDFLTDNAYVITNAVVAVLMAESCVTASTLKTLPLWMRAYGFSFYAANLLSVFRAFLIEAYELEEVVDHGAMDESRIYNVWNFMQFAFFFWNVEFHLACTERVLWQAPSE